MMIKEFKYLTNQLDISMEQICLPELVFKKSNKLLIT